MKHPIHSKLPQSGTTIFTVMSSLAQEHGAINLGQGFPDFEMPEALVSLVSEAMKSGKNQYTHMCGLPLLRQRISEKIQSLYGTEISPETDITITPGGTYAIYTAFTSILQPGDEVILFEPSYDSYIPNILANGAVPVRIPLCFPDYSIDWEKVKSAVSSKTRAIIINSPHNPTGTLISEQDIQQLRNIVAGTDIFIISDEVYEHLIFDQQTHHSILKYPDLYQRSFVCFSFGKVFHCTGWKIGYCVAPEHMMKEFRKIHQFNCFSCNTPVQYGIAEFISNQEHYLQLGSFLQKKRDYFQELMSQTPLKPLKSYGSYFQLYAYGHITEDSEIAYARKLTMEAGVATIPVSAFYQEPTDHSVLRFCFAKQETTLELAVERLKLYFNKQK